MPYKTDDPARQATSPFYRAGKADGREDARREPDRRLGMDPEKDWSSMYQRGYAEGLAGELCLKTRTGCRLRSLLR